MIYSPINLDYFLNMEIANGGISKQVVTLNGKLKTIRDLVTYWKSAPTPELTPENSQYYNCMIAGFRKDVGNHHDLGWENMTEEYYSSLEPMSDSEICDFLEKNPVEFTNGFIKHSYHRAYAMIGRLVRGERYIPFYMKTSQIYRDFEFDYKWNQQTVPLLNYVENEIKKMRLLMYEHFHRGKLDPHIGDAYGVYVADTIKKITNMKREFESKVPHPTHNIKLLKVLDAMGIDRSQYCLCQSSIISAMGIRQNDDLDIIISSKLRDSNVSWPVGVDVFPKDSSKFDYFGADGDDDILENFCINIDGYKFLEPRFYFARKNTHTDRDKRDWDGIKEFFKKESDLGYPFNFESYKWGLPSLRPRINVTELDLESLPLIKDKYNRVVDGINQGRAVYKGEGYYVKIFHPEYCRLQNFRDALDSGFLNGLAPSLTHLIEDDDKTIIGYITLSGTMLSASEFEFESIPNWFTRTVLRNCKKRNKIFYDFVPINMIRDSYYNQISLIDLESVYDIDKLDDMKKHNATIKPTNFLEEIEKI